MFKSTVVMKKIVIFMRDDSFDIQSTLMEWHAKRDARALNKVTKSTTFTLNEDNMKEKNSNE
jgi:hypothetical protein